MKKNWFTTGLTAILIAAMLATGVGAVSIGGGTTTTAVNFRTGRNGCDRSGERGQRLV